MQLGRLYFFLPEPKSWLCGLTTLLPCWGLDMLTPLVTNPHPPHACLLVEIRSRRGPAPPCPFYSLPRTGLMVGHGGSSGPDPLGLLLPEEKLRGGGSGRCKQQDGSKDKRPWKPAQNQHSCTRAWKTRDKMKEREREREKERRDRERKLYRVLLLVRWRRRERQIVSGLRRKNTEHTHTHTHT